MTNVHMLRVFINESGKFGDDAPVIIDEDKKLTHAERLALTIKLGANLKDGSPFEKSSVGFGLERINH